MINILLQKREPRTAMIIAFLSCSIWGLFWVPLRILENLGMHSLWSNFWFFVLPAPIIIYFGYREYLKEKSNLFAYILIGIFCGSAFSFYTAGLTVHSVTKTTVLFYLAPIWATFFGVLFLKEIIPYSRWICIVLGFVGCALVVQLKLTNLVLDKLDLLGFFSGITWSIGAIIIRFHDKLNVVTIAASLYFFSSFFTLIAIIIFGIEIPLTGSFIKSALPTVFFSVFFILPSFIIVLRVQQYLSPGLVTILMMSEILLAVISARVFLGEYMDYIQWIGAFLIVMTGVLIGIFEGDKKND